MSTIESTVSQLYQAVKEGDHAQLKLLLLDWPHCAAQLEDVRNDAGATPLHVAAAGGHLNAVQLQLKWGADPTATDKQLQTSLRLAAAGGHSDVVYELLRQGVRAKAKDEQLRTAWRRAAAAGSTTVLNVLLHSGGLPWEGLDAADLSGSIALQLAARAGHVNAVHLLLRAGAAACKVNSDDVAELCSMASSMAAVDASSRSVAHGLCHWQYEGHHNQGCAEVHLAACSCAR